MLFFSAHTCKSPDQTSWDIRPQIKCIVSLIIVGGHLIFLGPLCGYVWVNILYHPRVGLQYIHHKCNSVNIGEHACCLILIQVSKLLFVHLFTGLLHKDYLFFTHPNTMLFMLIFAPGLNNDIQCHVWPYCHLRLQITKSDMYIKCHVKLAVSMVIPNSYSKSSSGFCVCMWDCFQFWWPL